jgi:hypothetical protein
MSITSVQNTSITFFVYNILSPGWNLSIDLLKFNEIRLNHRDITHPQIPVASEFKQDLTQQ